METAFASGPPFICILTCTRHWKTTRSKTNNNHIAVVLTSQFSVHDVEIFELLQIPDVRRQRAVELVAAEVPETK